jgi:hypothetical protein
MCAFIELCLSHIKIHLNQQFVLHNNVVIFTFTNLTYGKILSLMQIQ